MVSLQRLFARFFDLAVALPVKCLQFLLYAVLLNPRLGPLRYLFAAAVGFLAFAFTLVYVAAPVRGVLGQYWMSETLRYASERWLATAIYDAKGSFVGTFDARLDSKRDVNFTGETITLGDYVANPDHKSIPVREVPEQYWQCLRYHEDRYLGGWLNPYGIDLIGVLKIPYSTVRRSIAAKRPRLGVGGSTLPMQFARVIFKTPPSVDEGGFTKLRRKVKEWWLAPVIYQELTRGGDDTPLKQWAANHIWLAQRTGGAPLHGVELTARVVFNKEAKDLSTAEQFVLASAVNKPIILLKGDDKLNQVREDRWRYITEIRAKKCAEALIADEDERNKVSLALVAMGSGPPDPKVRPVMQAALGQFSPQHAKRAQANPEIRANILAPEGRYGVREEMKHDYGFGWRDYVRGVRLTFDVLENRAFRESVRARLAQLNAQYAARIGPGYTLDLDAAGTGGADSEATGRKMPHVVVAAATWQGEIVRYFESSDSAPYFGSPFARDANGRYHPEKEARAVASTGKMLAAVAIANEGRDTVDTLYVDNDAPSTGLEACERGPGAGNRTSEPLRRGRRALVAFACSLNRPLEWRAAQLGQEPMRRLTTGFGFNLPYTPAGVEETPPSTAVVRGLITGSPRKVHQMSSVVLSAMVGQGGRPVRLPTLVKRYDYVRAEYEQAANRDRSDDLVPNRLIRREALPLLRTFLQAPLCYQHNKVQHGTLRQLAGWCAERRPDLRFHFAKTGTHVTEDPNATVDAWITGGLQFANGAAYSYVVLVGTGNVREPWARSLHAGQVAAPLLEALLADLAELAKKQPMPGLLPAPPQTQAAPGPAVAARTPTGSIAKDGPAREQVFNK